MLRQAIGGAVAALAVPGEHDDLTAGGQDDPDTRAPRARYQAASSRSAASSSSRPATSTARRGGTRT